jgi:uncharacterized paraquat-inducible protein A
MKTSDQLKFVVCRCHNCGEHIEVPVDYINTTAECPHCKTATILKEKVTASRVKKIKTAETGSGSVVKIICEDHVTAQKSVNEKVYGLAFAFRWLAILTPIVAIAYDMIKASEDSGSTAPLGMTVIIVCPAVLYFASILLLALDEILTRLNQLQSQRFTGSITNTASETVLECSKCHAPATMNETKCSSCDAEFTG